MFSAKKKPERTPRSKGARLPSLKAVGDLRPRLSIRVWLTVLFVLVTAVALTATYWTVKPILEDSLRRASDAAFRQVGEQFEERLGQLERRGDTLTEQEIRAFAQTRGLQWGIVRVEGQRVARVRGDNDLEPLWGVVTNAVEAG